MLTCFVKPVVPGHLSVTLTSAADVSFTMATSAKLKLVRMEPCKTAARNSRAKSRYLLGIHNLGTGKSITKMVALPAVKCSKRVYSSRYDIRCTV